MAKLLDGKKLAADRVMSLRRRVNELKRRRVVPGLAIIMVGSNPASQVYVRNKRLACEQVGIKFLLKRFKSVVSQAEITREIKKLNASRSIHGIILQLPVPKKFDPLQLILAIDPTKDVDGLHPVNLGLLALGCPLFLPATPKGILELLERYKVNLRGKQVTIVGFGQVVGMPLSLLLAQKRATVTIANSATHNLKSFTSNSDILIAAAGTPHLIKAAMVKRGAVVIDAGISKVGKRFVGDVDFNAVSRRASYITPVPGGVGPMTVSSLIANVVQSASDLSI